MVMNRRRRIGTIRLKYKLSYENCFMLLLGLIWADKILVSYVRAVLIRLPYISDFREYIVSSVFLCAAILALPYISKRINPGMVIAYLAAVAVYLMNMLLYPQNEEALNANLVPFLIKSLPLVFVGAAIDLKKHYRMLYLISAVTVTIRFVHLLIEPVNFAEGDMNSSYLLLPHVCLIVAAALSERNLLNISLSLMGIFSIISFGSRGPIVCILFLVIFYMIFFSQINKHVWLFITVFFMMLGLTVYFEQILQVLLALIQRMGMSTRVVSMLLSGDIAYTTGRDVILRRLMEAVSENWFGYGIAGDRAIVGVYAHNILIELWVSYGVLMGTILFGVPVAYTIVLLIRKSRVNAVEYGLILALIVAHFMKLFISGTYLTEGNLYLLIGLIMVESRTLKKEKRSLKD